MARSKRQTQTKTNDSQPENEQNVNPTGDQGAEGEGTNNDPDATPDETGSDENQENQNPDESDGSPEEFGGDGNPDENEGEGDQDGSDGNTPSAPDVDLTGEAQEIDRGVNVQSLEDGTAVLATNISQDVQPSGLSGYHPIETALQAPGGAVYHQGVQISPDPVNGPQSAAQAPSTAEIQQGGAKREQSEHVGESYVRGSEPDGVILFAGTDARVPYEQVSGGNEIIITQDTFRKVYPARSNRPTYLLLYPKGRRLPAIMAQRDPDFKK